jgi:ssRNA-specific RNase YbeY (16S rRNA maturation enzyme)
MRARLSICMLVALFTALVMTGCASHNQYRTSYAPCVVKLTETACEKASLEQHDGYLLGHVEFDDQGSFWDREQMRVIIDTLQSKEYLESGVIMLVFVHGWKHNASFDDENVEEFRKSLRRIHKLEFLAAKKQQRPPRKVAGIYVGWRGQSVPVPLVDNLTFWDRKNTADNVGHRALTELLIQLENVQISHLDVFDNSKDRLARSRLIIIGHSFGGQIVYSALSQILLDRFVGEEAYPPETLGDLVILVNPAFEAARFIPLRDASVERKWYAAGQLPLLAIFTAKNDEATGTAFPIGRWFSTLFDKHKDSMEKSANRRTVGHFTPFISHNLTWNKGVAKEPEVKSTAENAPTAQEKDRAELSLAQADLESSAELKIQWRAISAENGWSLDFDGVRLTHLGKTQPLNPLYVVSVDSEIIDGHGGIWKKEFSDFVRRFILFSVMASDATP